MNFMRNDFKLLVANLLDHFGILPGRYRRSMQVLAARKEADRIWNGRKLSWCTDGYWWVDPMPTDFELAAYYDSTYWNSRVDKGTLLKKRDIGHFVFLKEYIPCGGKQLRVLNFGAGHGGISYLYFSMGFDVVNVEPSGIDLPLNWTVLKNIGDASGDFDLIYSSHSLEHVRDVDQFLERVRRLLKPGGLVFFEVPNCHENSKTAYPHGTISPPHTYYFTREFFNTLDYDVLCNSTYLQGGMGFDEQTVDDTGDVVRFLGRKLVLPAKAE